MAGGQGRRRADSLHVQAQRKMEIRDQVRTCFARYGDKACAKILEAAMLPHGLAKLLDRLGLPAGRKQESQIDTLARYLSEEGPSKFLRRMEAPKSTVASGLGPELIEVDDEAEEPDRPAERTGDGRSGKDATQERRRAGDTGSATAMRAAQPKETPPEWFDAKGKYIGPERRNGKDRRSGKDRRNRIDCINKNKRYGGDRRKNLRRKADRETGTIDKTRRA